MLSTTDAAEAIKQKTGVDIPQWRLRRVFDSLNDRGVITVQRLGIYRAIGPNDLAAVETELRRLKCLPEAESATA